jgi:type IV pilus assembly protein PilA
VSTGGGLPPGNVTLVPLNIIAGVPTPAVAANLSAGPVAINGWRCGLPADGTTILSKYLPGSCRGS